MKGLDQMTTAAREVVKKNFDTLWFFLDTLQMPGMELLLGETLADMEYCEDGFALGTTLDVIRQAFPREITYEFTDTGVGEDNDVYILTEYAVGIKALAKIARQLHKYDKDAFPKEAIPDEECVNALLQILNMRRFLKKPPQRTVLRQAS